ncbi:MAG TPA: GGDEF domain-containing protein, partial [Candidatus Binatia bacterium]|nr:GGDEF domain-containing protein [Candidatus Binatia bacterium]
AGRWGGEEFLVLLPGFDKESAMHAARMLLNRIATFTVPIMRAINIKTLPPQDKIRNQITVSMGIATYPEDTRATGQDTFDELVRIADERLYMAKRGDAQGNRNRAVSNKGVILGMPF